ncbi:hypothetical protein HAX54_007635, partial [Datura stramonium]|nr:hypothetical protein [Datura stramonium]
CHTCGVCGGLDGHWSHSPNSYSHSPRPYYDPPVVCYDYRNNEEEEHHAQLRNMEKLILDHMEVLWLALRTSYLTSYDDYFNTLARWWAWSPELPRLKENQQNSGEMEEALH